MLNGTPKHLARGDPTSFTAAGCAIKPEPEPPKNPLHRDMVHGDHVSSSIASKLDPCLMR